MTSPLQALNPDFRLEGATPRACVIGDPISHSRSPLIHSYWLRHLELPGSYHRLLVPRGALKKFLSTLADHALVGCNITVPHKVDAMACMDWVEPTAEALGAINTVWLEDERLCGANTDVSGFLDHLDASIPDLPQGGQALVLGAGGAARAVVYALLQRGFEIDLINRSPLRAEELANSFDKKIHWHDFGALNACLPHADLLINTTSLGMVGQPKLEIDLVQLPDHCVVYDLVYVPLETDLLRQARQRGLRCVDGLGMLLHQARPGFARWFGVNPQVDDPLRQLLAQDIEAALTPRAR